MGNRIPVDKEEIIDYLIDGITDLQLRNQARMQHFQSASALLNAFENISVSSETKHRSNREMSSKTEIKDPKVQPKQAQGDDTTRTLKCYNCNTKGHLSRNCRKPKRDPGTCFQCGEAGHKVNDCSKRMKEKGKEADLVNNVEEASQMSAEIHQCALIQIKAHNNNNLNIEVDTLLDTGSPTSFIKRKFVPNEILLKTGNDDSEFYGINKTKLEILGKIFVTIKLNGIAKENVLLYVVPNNTMSNSVILGRDALKQFNLKLIAVTDENCTWTQEIQEILNINADLETKTLTDNLNINPQIPNEFQLQLKSLFISNYVQTDRPAKPQINTQLKLNLRDHKPFHFSPRRLSYAEKEELRKILDRLLQKEIIQPSESEYASPIVLVKKKNNEYRLCVDYRVLNKVTIRDNYPLPLIEDQLEILRNKKYFSLLDLKDGFHHIDVKKESVKYTSFVTPLGQFEYKKMPFGLKTAPSKFQKFVNTVPVRNIELIRRRIYIENGMSKF